MKIFLTIFFLNLIFYSYDASAGAKSGKAELFNFDLKSPHLKIKMLNGKIFDLENSDNQITIISFWNYWCKYCKSELDKLNKINLKYKAHNQDQKKLTIIGISIDDRDKLKKVLKITENLSFDNAIFEDVITTNINKPKSIPKTYIFDSKQRLVNIFDGESDDDEIEEIVLKNLE